MEKIQGIILWLEGHPALLAAATALLAIVSSVGICCYTNYMQLKLQKSIELQDMKRAYYNEFTEAYTKRLMYQHASGSIEKTEADMKFFIEVNRLPLYASEEMIKFINDMKDPEKAANTSTADYYSIMRKDLYSTNLEEYHELENIEITIPGKVVITDNEGNKVIHNNSAADSN